MQDMGKKNSQMPPALETLPEAHPEPRWLIPEGLGPPRADHTTYLISRKGRPPLHSLSPAGSPKDRFGWHHSHGSAGLAQLSQQGQLLQGKAVEFCSASFRCQAGRTAPLPWGLRLGSGSLSYQAAAPYTRAQTSGHLRVSGIGS